MRFGIFYEHQLPRPWPEGGELKLFQDALSQVELADRLGIDIQQGGNNRHDHICESLELFARDVMPEFKERDAARQARKMKELAPYIEAAFERKKSMPALAERS